MNTDMVLLPRAWVEALVDPNDRGYTDFYAETDTYECHYCRAGDIYPKAATLDGYNHEANCPVRLIQEALKEQP